jgi:hypothetical protein
MKKTTLTALLFLGFTVLGFAQTADEIAQIKSKIKELEKIEATAFVKQDYACLDSLWSPDFIVNSAKNIIEHDAAEIKHLLKTGAIKNAALERTVEEVLVKNNMAISLGSEVVTSMQGKVVKRRYMNIWIKPEKQWKVIASQHSIILEPVVLPADDMTIRLLDSIESAAFLKNDTTTLINKIWSKDYVVMNPFNNIVTIKDVLKLMSNQKITQIPFKRTIEKITFSNNIAFVMGTEIPDVSKAAAGVPKNVSSPRRFTNVWTKYPEGWRLTGRQATNIVEIPTNQPTLEEKEAEIRRLENLEREAVLKNDTATSFNQFWSPDMIVNAPANSVSNLEFLKKRMSTGKLNYARFDRKIENITFNDNLAIVMGEEKLEPQGAAENAGKTITRRFTNIWKYANSSWRIIARQSTIIKVE